MSPLQIELIAIRTYVDWSIFGIFYKTLTNPPFISPINSDYIMYVCMYVGIYKFKNKVTLSYM